MAPTPALFSEGQKHSSTKVMAVLHGDVLALPRSFFDQHPGGDELLREFAGKDITAEFEAAAHSESARKWAATFVVGKSQVKKPSASKIGPRALHSVSKELLL
eukprot:CAMPEP_0195102560 /NCGR_PEP_ID=MMETSP0448-20130528/68386_1 /TAXON_ID=66468 /ORGANISM="Heterocapsa triquestra, Strain CCMP 448" /LENGTH=102 /DNA_ID=CAMNT_0040138081 /DNA_START=9 /DNA_END=314 /DNA_ORIENTATION=+